MRSAWRAWSVDQSGRLTRAFWHANSQVWGRGWVDAFCDLRHPAPAADCWCGIHVVTSEAEMWAYVNDRFRPGRSAPCAVGRVDYAGAVRSSLVSGDPPSTLRVERARIIGPLVPLPGAETQGEALRQRYGVTVIDRELAELRAALYGTPVPAHPQPTNTAVTKESV